MIIEDMFIAHWLKSKDPNFLSAHDLDVSYFNARGEVIQFINEFIAKYGSLPTVDTLLQHFDWLSIPEELDPVEYVVEKLRESKILVEIRPILIEAATELESGDPVKAIQKLRYEIDSILEKSQKKVVLHDWVKDALQRYEAYLERAEKRSNAVLSTGIKKLDDIVGGWREDDLVLIAGRTNEGKSYVGVYFAYLAWMQLKKLNSEKTVVYITTEMPELEVAWRLDTLKAHFSNRALTEGRLDSPEAYREYLEQLASESPSFMIMSNEANDGRRYTPADIKRVIDLFNPGLIVIDQLYDLSDGTNERDIRKRIVNVTNALREIGLYTSTPIILIAQAGREAVKDSKKDSDTTPELHHIQESDTPAQKATKVITIRKIGDIIKLTVRKNRGGERDRDVVLRADIDKGIWEEIFDVEAVF